MSNGQNSLSEAQVSTLSQYFSRKSIHNWDGKRNRLAVSLMLHAGLRLGECVQITWEMLILNDRPLEAINLDASITKTKQSRSIPICRKLREDIALFLCGRSPLHGYVFPGGTGRHPFITPRSIQKILGKASLECLGLSVHPHMLRHTFASRMLKVTNLRIVQELLGHSSVRSTQIYTHPDQEDLKNATSALDKLNKGL